jgi:hypothetical protein
MQLVEHSVMKLLPHESRVPSTVTLIVQCVVGSWEWHAHVIHWRWLGGTELG